MLDTKHIVIELQRIEESLDKLARHLDEQNTVVTGGEQKAVEKQVHRTADALRKLLRHYNMRGEL